MDMAGSNEQVMVGISKELREQLRKAAEKYGFKIGALVAQGIQMRLDALAKEKR